MRSVPHTHASVSPAVRQRWLKNPAEYYFRFFLIMCVIINRVCEFVGLCVCVICFTMAWYGYALSSKNAFWAIFPLSLFLSCPLSLSCFLFFDGTVFVCHLCWWWCVCVNQPNGSSIIELDSLSSHVPLSCSFECVCDYVSLIDR